MKDVKRKIHYDSIYKSPSPLTGKGITIALLDSGVAPHPDLTPRLVGWMDCISRNPYIYDDNGHGTHVSGILVGSGRAMGRNGTGTAGGMPESESFAGMAPQANLVAVKVLNEKGGGQIANVIHGIHYVLLNQKRLNIRIVNISLGTKFHPGDADETELLHWVERLWDSGIVVVTAAGNFGPGDGSITLPGISRKVITVGACEAEDIRNADPGHPQEYSGCGPTSDCIQKPDISAPGNHIYSCSHRYPRFSRLPYIKKSGTSMATPVVAGAAALLLEKYPDMTNVEVKMRLWDSCEDLGLPVNRQGHGRLDMRKLLK